MSKSIFLNTIKDDPGPCEICEAINKTYTFYPPHKRKGKEGECDCPANACLAKDRTLIKLLYHLFLQKS